MLERIKELVAKGDSFAFETTLSSKAYVKLLQNAQQKGYEIILLFLLLDSMNLAIERVLARVKEGGHNIPVNVIKRRFSNDLKNLFNLYIPFVDKWVLVDNSNEPFEFIAEGAREELIIRNEKKWSNLKNEYDER